MNIRTKKASCITLLAVAIGLAATAALAFGDCNRAGRAAETGLPGTIDSRAETTASLADPALDGLMSRYADLHRDAVGYAVAGVVDTPLYARAAAAADSPVAR
jgi:hypothetical protein